MSVNLTTANHPIPFAKAVERDGFAIVSDALTVPEADELASALEDFVAGNEATGLRGRGGNVFGVRNLLAQCEAVRAVARSSDVRRFITPTLGPDCFAVRAILFDKTSGANWRVPYHQDLSIAVARRADGDGWGPWSEKAGALHVQPPVSVLEKMLTIRLHLDPCGPENGPLRVLAATHNRGKLSPDDIANARERIAETICAVAASGGAVIMRPLLLHASSPAQLPHRRRVLHIEYASQALPDGVEWRDTV